MRSSKQMQSGDEYMEAGLGFTLVNRKKNPSLDLSGQQMDLDDARRVREDEERRSRSHLHDLPPHSNTGGKLTKSDTGYEICIDWIRMSGPRQMRHAAVDLLSTYYGSATYGKGRHFLNSGYRFGNAGVYFDADDQQVRDHAVVDLPGEAMSEVTMSQSVEILDGLFKLGFKMCRLDIAIDMYDKPDLIDMVTQSCLNGELCRARRFEPKYMQNGKQKVGHGCNVGVRGKNGSGRYLRVYDKNLQTKEGPAGGWTRWEAELSDDCAQEAAMQMVQASDLISVALSHAFGVCDFRIDTGSEHVSRRPRVEWFEELIGEICPSRVVQTRAKSTLHSFKRWMQTAVVPKLETLSAATGHSMGGLMSVLFGEFEPDPNHLEDHKIRALCIEAGADPSEALRRLGSRRLVLITAEAGL
ncbi:hypothetical protein COB72_00825 [bacterium]|nr:MAG: hypothetical protein COB72_00825 [bacterium]